MRLFPRVIRTENPLKLRDFYRSTDAWYNAEKFEINVVWTFEDDDRLRVLCNLSHEMGHHIISLFSMTYRSKMMRWRSIGNRLHDCWDFVWTPTVFQLSSFFRSIGIKVEGGNFKFVAPDSVKLMNLFEALNKINDIAKIELTGNGLRTHILDPSHVAMICLEMPKTSFDECHLDEYAGVGCAEMIVDLRDLVKMLKGASEGEKAILSRRKGELKLSIQRHGKTVFEIDECKKATETLPEPDLMFDGGIKLMTDVLVNALDKLKTDTEIVKLEISNQGLTMKSNAEERQTKTKISWNNTRVFCCKGKAEAQYKLTWLRDILAQLNKVCNELILEFSTDMPLRLKTVTPNHESLTFYLAPIITIDRQNSNG